MKFKKRLRNHERGETQSEDGRRAAATEPEGCSLNLAASPHHEGEGREELPPAEPDNTLSLK